MFCHLAWLQISPARFKQVYFDKAGKGPAPAHLRDKSAMGRSKATQRVKKAAKPALIKLPTKKGNAKGAASRKLFSSMRAMPQMPKT
jgi:hypothetical protein